MIEFSTMVGSLSVDVHLSNRINVLIGDSGMGKTFLMRIIENRYINSGIHLTHFDYAIATSANIQEQFRLISDNDIVLLDNADLYMTKDLFGILLNGKCTVVVSLKSLLSLPYGDIGEYFVRYAGNSLKTEMVVVV